MSSLTNLRMRTCETVRGVRFKDVERAADALAAHWGFECPSEDALEFRAPKQIGPLNFHSPCEASPQIGLADVERDGIRTGPTRLPCDLFVGFDGRNHPNLHFAV